jgi:hypothetical protein
MVTGHFGVRKKGYFGGKKALIYLESISRI